MHLIPFRRIPQKHPRNPPARKRQPHGV
jgi:hypothetical protein